MRVNRVKIPEELIFLEPLGDIHIGNIACDEEKLRKRIEHIRKTPNQYWIGMGDYIEAIYPTSGGITDKRFSHRFIKRDIFTPEEQINYVASLFDPIKDKCLGLLEGNHEWKLGDKYGINLVEQLANRLGVKYLGPVGFIELKLRESTPIVILACHGHYTGVKKGGAVNKIQDLAAFFDADIYLMGHVHKRFFDKDEYISVRGGKIIHALRSFGLTGHFLRTYVADIDTYGERRLIQPGRVGTITIKIQADGEVYGYE